MRSAPNHFAKGSTCTYLLMGLTQRAARSKSRETIMRRRRSGGIRFWRRDICARSWIYEKFKSLFVVRECERARDASVGLVYGVLYVCMLATCTSAVYLRPAWHCSNYANDNSARIELEAQNNGARRRRRPGSCIKNVTRLICLLFGLVCKQTKPAANMPVIPLERPNPPPSPLFAFATLSETRSPARA